MQLEFALLCDAVTQREGLLNILGAGVAVTGKGAFPAPLGVDLAASVLLEENQLGKNHRLNVRIAAEDGSTVGELVAEFSADRTMSKEMVETVRAGLPVRFPPNALLPAPGNYAFEVRVNDELVATLPLIAFGIDAAAPLASAVEENP